MNSFSDASPHLHAEFSEDEDDQVSQRVRELLSKRGVAIHKQGSELSTFLGVARSTIHRKFKNGGWSAAELRAIAEQWRGRVEDLLGDSDATAPPSDEAIKAQVMISGMPTSATLLLGPPLGLGDSCDLVALNLSGQWTVYTGGTEPLNIPRHSIRKLSFSAMPRLKIALLEDDKLAADALAEDLMALGGVDVQKFYRPEELLSALQLKQYDAYVIDWLLGGGATAETCIRQVRDQQKMAPIVVTTGAMALQANAEQILIPFCEHHRVGIIEKKFRAAVLLAHLRRDLKTSGLNPS